MNMARASASVSVVDGKIYVFGGSEHHSKHDTWAEVFDRKTQTWSPLLFLSQIWDIETPQNKNIHQSVVIEGKKIFAVDEEDQSFYILPSECLLSITNKRDSKLGYKNDWCIIGKLLYCRGTRGRILWCEPDELNWKEMKGLEELQDSHYGSRRSFKINKLCSNSAGNIVIFWNSESLDLWSAEISMERREGGEIWGKIEWSDVVFEVDPSSHSSYGVKVLYSAFVYA
ncbi:PREDICTED: putative F-box/kelch-repeat protein At3g24610 [Camelina sativa]|uniref:F-box/kelch-repeat protein At3g24610 n=1 Tax=Camelina sativa TaxID=90675 RepID=A0ABM0URX3_CAMSA|nr:PREDICTED: putative F-box/kelch-repeat protein At3g24610 [Camelina sativa]